MLTRYGSTVSERTSTPMPPAEFPFAKLRDRPGYLLWQLSMRWRRDVGRALAPLELTHTQFVCLAALRWLEGQGGPGPSKSAVARHTGLDRMQAAKVMRDLESRGLVTTAPDPADARAHSLATTEAGRTSVGRALALVAELDEALFGARAGEVAEALSSVLPEGEDE